MKHGAAHRELVGAPGQAEQRHAERVGARAGGLDRVLVGRPDDRDHVGRRELLDGGGGVLAVTGGADLDRRDGLAVGDPRGNPEPGDRRLGDPVRLAAERHDRAENADRPARRRRALARDRPGEPERRARRQRDLAHPLRLLGVAGLVGQRHEPARDDREARALAVGQLVERAAHQVRVGGRDDLLEPRHDRGALGRRDPWIQQIERGQRSDRRIAGLRGRVRHRGEVLGAIVVVLDRGLSGAQQRERPRRIALVVPGDPEEQRGARGQPRIGFELDDVAEDRRGVAELARLDVGDAGVQLRPRHDGVRRELGDDALELAGVPAIAQELGAGLLEPGARHRVAAGRRVGDQRAAGLAPAAGGHDKERGQDDTAEHDRHTPTIAVPARDRKSR